MVNGYQIVYRPALTSRHIQKRAIDMTITEIMNKSMKSFSGVHILITSATILYEVGATYGIINLNRILHIGRMMAINMVI